MQRTVARLVRSAAASLLVATGFLVGSSALGQTPIPNTGSYASGQTVYNGGLINGASQSIPGCISCHFTPLPNSATTGVGGSNITAANSVANITAQITSQYAGDGNTCNSYDMSQFATGCANRLSSTDLAHVAAYVANNHHFGGLQTGFDTSKTPGDPARANYVLFLDWALSGAPQ